MHSFVLVAFFTVFATTNAGLLIPSTRTAIAGPTTIISSISPGAGLLLPTTRTAIAGQSTIVSAITPGAVTYTAPAVLPSSESIVAAPVSPYITTYSASLVSAPIIPAHDSVDTIVSGPSGTIATSGRLNALDTVSQAHDALILKSL